MNRDRFALMAEKTRAKLAHKPSRHIDKALVRATNRQLRAELSSPTNAQLAREIAEGRA